MLLAVLLVVVIFLRRKDTPEDVNLSRERKTRTQQNTTTQPDRNRGFDRRVSYLEYTAHARCRMQCRKISQREVEEIMRDGKINYKKSDMNDKPCPTYALEGMTSDQQRVRIVFAQCDKTTKVVTCIDLDTDFECDCPGDKRK